MVNQQRFLEGLIDGINLKTEEDVGPLVDERNRLDRRLREIRGQIERYIEVLGQQDATISRSNCEGPPSDRRSNPHQSFKRFHLSNGVGHARGKSPDSATRPKRR